MAAEVVNVTSPAAELLARSPAVLECGCSTSGYVSYLQIKLPAEILIQILSPLSPRDKLSVRLTCRRLYAVASDPAIWGEFYWRYYGTSDDKPLKTALKISPLSVKKLEIRASGHFATSKFSRLFQRCQNLQSLVLRGFAICASQLDMLVSSCSLLSHVSIECKDRYHASIILQIAKNLKSVVVIVDRLNHYSLAAILKGWSLQGYHPEKLGIGVKSNPFSFTSICVAHDWYVVAEALPPSEHKASLSLYAQMPSEFLPDLPAFEVQFPGQEESRHDGSPTAVPSLASLDSHSDCQFGLSSTHDTEQDCYSSAILLSNLGIVPSCQSFTSVSQSIGFLEMRGTQLLTPNLLQSIADFCPSLMQLDIEGCSNALTTLSGLDTVAHKCPRMRNLNVKGIHVDHVEDTVALWDTFSQMKRLRHLAMSLCLVGGKSSSELAVTLGSKSHWIALEVEGEGCMERQMPCPCRFTDHELLFLSELGSLEYLRMAFLPGISLSSGFTTLFTRLQRLKYLYLAKREFGKLTLPSDPQCYTCLQQLCILCWNFTMLDCLVEALIHNGQLTHVYLAIDFISKEALLDIVQKLPYLKSCHVYVWSQVVPRGQTTQLTRALKSTAKHSGVNDFIFWHNVGRTNKFPFVSYLPCNLNQLWY